MLVPSGYRLDDPAQIREVIAAHPLATLVSNGDPWPHATQLPVICPPSWPVTTPLAGATLRGHLNRANPHWTDLRPGQPAKLLFAGAQGYVTPAIYRTTPAAPTWDFVAVHLLGHVEPLDGVDAALEVVRATVAQFEPRFGDGWDPEASLGYFRSIAPGVGAFEFHVTEVQAMAKLSQEQPPEVRERVVDRFTASGSDQYQALAAMMKR